jgi:hypothetical protein
MQNSSHAPAWHLPQCCQLVHLLKTPLGKINHLKQPPLRTSYRLHKPLKFQPLLPKLLDQMETVQISLPLLLKCPRQILSKPPRSLQQLLLLLPRCRRKSPPALPPLLQHKLLPLPPL